MKLRDRRNLDPVMKQRWTTWIVCERATVRVVVDENRIVMCTSVSDGDA